MMASYGTGEPWKFESEREAVVPETAPTLEKPESLSLQHHKALAEVARLKEKIDDCVHEWIEGEQHTATHTLELGESIGSSDVWVLRQVRDCQVCGLHECRTKYQPNWDWSPWGNKE